MGVVTIEQVQETRRATWVVGKTIQCILFYRDAGGEWVGTNAKVEIIWRRQDKAGGRIVDVGYLTDGKPANGRFDGLRCTIDVLAGRASLRPGNPEGPRGRKLRKDIRLTDVASERLRKHWQARSVAEPGLTEDEIVNALIMQLPEELSPTPAEWDGEVL